MAGLIIRRKDIINEIMSLVPCKWQVAKEILELSEKLPTHFKLVFRGIARRPMSQPEALRYVLAARQRIELVDSTG